VTDRRLIEHTFPLGPVSAEAAREKSLRRGHISTLHIWWARRPLVMARAITMALLLHDPQDDATEKELVRFITEFANFDKSIDARILQRARQLIKDASGGLRPRILDPFSGGGALPLEALRVGADVDALELNPVAYVLLLCTLDYPMRLRDRRAPEGLGDRSALSYWVEKGAAELRRHVQAEVRELYSVPPGRVPANAYLWARTLMSIIQNLLLRLGQDTARTP
jgi:putative DNA methylase